MSTFRMTFKEPKRKGQPQMTLGLSVQAGNTIEAIEQARRVAQKDMPGCMLVKAERLTA